MQINWCEKTLGIIRLMRVQQYYKNLIILVGIFLQENYLIFLFILESFWIFNFVPNFFNYLYFK